MTQTSPDETYGLLPDLIPQLVNRNGSSKEYLLEDYKNCLAALRSLEAAMGKAMPHGRDYQTHSNPDAASRASKAWGYRRIWLDCLRRDLQHSAEMVAGQ